LIRNFVSLIRRYAEEIEKKLQMLGIRVDLLFPNENIPINKVLANIQNRGCLYAVLILPQNYHHDSLTLTILYGDAIEHRNIPTEDAIKLIYKDFVNKTRGITTNTYEHPDVISMLLKILSENRSLTAAQYDHIVKYLAQRRDYQLKSEIGEESPTMEVESEPLAIAESSGNGLQQKILEILNRKPLQLAAPPRPLTQAERDELKRKLLQDDKVKMAMDSIISARKRIKL